jgi:hypothetical protein
MISNIHKNRMGTISFDGLFPGMRKAQDFIVYPIKAGDDGGRLLIQSDTRIGHIYLDTGRVSMSKPHPGGAYFIHLGECRTVGTLAQEDLFNLKAHVFSTAHGDAGRAENRIIGCDNSGALEVFA